MKTKSKFIIILILFSIYLLVFSSICFAADPKLITTIKKAFESIESWILKLATPAAAVAVAVVLATSLKTQTSPPSINGNIL